MAKHGFIESARTILNYAIKVKIFYNVFFICYHMYTVNIT